MTNVYELRKKLKNYYCTKPTVSKMPFDYLKDWEDIDNATPQEIITMAKKHGMLTESFRYKNFKENEKYTYDKKEIREVLVQRFSKGIFSAINVVSLYTLSFDELVELAKENGMDLDEFVCEPGRNDHVVK